jgi:hypothetical protein
MAAAPDEKAVNAESVTESSFFVKVCFVIIHSPLQKLSALPFL